MPRIVRSVLLGAVAAGLTSARAVPQEHAAEPNGTTANGDACKQVASVLAPRGVSAPGATTVDAELAYQCLTSIPVIEASTLNQTIDSIKKLSEWHSTTVFYNDPQLHWLDEPLNLSDEIDGVSGKFDSKGYTNEYALESDIADVFARGKDGHLLWQGAAFRDVLIFNRPTEASLVSVFTGKNQTVFLKDQVASGKPNAITTINGVEASQFLQTEADRNGVFYDKDAVWNSMFFSDVSDGKRGNFFNNPIYYPGPYTNFTFEDGTTKSIKNLATAAFTTDWPGIHSNQDVLDKLVIANDSDVTEERRLRRKREALETPYLPSEAIGGHHVRDMAVKRPSFSVLNGLIAGRILDISSGQPVAILELGTFETDAKDVQFFISTFLTACTANKITKIIIDLRGNRGGNVHHAYETFAQFFPTITPYGGMRFRAHPQVAEVSSLLSKGNAPKFPDNPFSPPSYVDEQSQPFKAWTQLYGPQPLPPPQQSESFSNVFRDKPRADSSKDRKSNNKPPFAPSNIALLSDSTCASTCAMFVEFMTQDSPRPSAAGGGISPIIKIAIGGRTTSSGPMTLTGGTKGALVLSQHNLEFFTQQMGKMPRGSGPPATKNDMPGRSGIETRDTGVNWFNLMRKGSPVVPVQFLFDAADCRMRYRPETVLDRTKLWREAWAAAWGDDAQKKGACFTEALLEAAPTNGTSGSGNGTAVGPITQTLGDRNGTVTTGILANWTAAGNGTNGTNGMPGGSSTNTGSATDRSGAGGRRRVVRLY